MKVLKINSIGGLHHEMFEPDPEFFCSKINVSDCFLDANSFFWSKHFSVSRINELIDVLSFNKSNIYSFCPQYKAILSNRELFIKKVIEAPKKLCYEANTPQEFFSCLETISILCKLYSDFEYFPFSLNIQNGFNLNENNSYEIYNNCLNPKKNPYYSFVVEEIIPIIKENNPDVLFLYGQMSYYFATLSLLIKQFNPKIHICLSRHSSEYYSMNKIIPLLKQNKYLFKIIDSIILDSFEEMEEKLISSLEDNNCIGSVPNILFINDSKEIIETNFSEPCFTNDFPIYKRMHNEKNTNKKVYDIHFDPYIKCHWNKCSFCGINKKYRNRDWCYSEQTFNRKATSLNLLSQECDYLWFVDEALSPDKLRNIAVSFINAKTSFKWQARCRADYGLLENGLPELLAEAGLKELRIGLESGSYKVLKLMNKFDKNFNLSLIESIVSTYEKNGISIHCPMIIGFPQEEDIDRQYTYEFLLKLSKSHPSFTFNINILNLDVSSELYKNWANYQLDRLEYPCEPQYFLGNSIAWIDSLKHNKLSIDVNNFMREVLFPWIPADSLISPTIFYRLCETSRNTLRWKSIGTWYKSKQLFSSDMNLTLSNKVSISQSEDRVFFYQWNSHHYLHGNTYLYNLLVEFKTNSKVSKVINKLNDLDPNVYVKEELISLINKLFEFGFLEGEYTFNDLKNLDDIEKAYDSIYQEGNLIYKIEPDRLLIDWQNILVPGQALELGVGLGKNIDFLLDKGFSVTGVDISSVAIEKLNQKYHSSNCSFLVNDINTFEIPHEKYSLIICSLVLSYLNDTELILLSNKIKNGLCKGGFFYLTDLSERDPLSIKPSNQTTDHRNFFSCSKIQSLFKELNIIELSDVYRKNPHRIGCENAFGLINYLGYKPKS